MKRFKLIPIAPVIIAGILFLFFSACNSKDKKTQGIEKNDMDDNGEDDIGAARNFIRAALDGKFDEARKYLLPDSINANWMDVAERSYLNTDADTKRGYRSSSINIYQVQPLNDSATLVNYSNSYKNHQYILRVLKIKGQWLVDLNYLYQHDLENQPGKTVNKDTIK
jgi:hypothetical protein